MAKRFVSGELWDKEWFMDLKPSEKCLYLYLVTRCSSIGIYRINKRLVQIQIGSEIAIDEIIDTLVQIKQVELLPDGRLWLPEFCDFQYGPLKETSIPHRSYMEALKKEGLIHRVVIGYKNPTKRVKEKEKDKEKDKDNILRTVGISSTSLHTLVNNINIKLYDIVVEFASYRKSTGKKMTEKAICLFTKKLNDYSGGDLVKAQQLIDNAIERNWQTVYEPSENFYQKKQPSFQKPASHKIYQPEGN